MKLYLNSEEVEMINRYHLLIGVKCCFADSDNPAPSLFILGSQVRLVIQNIFDCVWCDSTKYDDKFWLSQFGTRLVREVL